MATHEEIARYWTDCIGEGILPGRMSGANLQYDGFAIGGRWNSGDIAEYLPAGKGRGRPLFLLTGDRWASPGWGHESPQDTVRRAIAAAAPTIGADVLIVPFSALDGAGIDRRSIVPLEIREDHFYDVEHSSADIRDVPRRERTLTRREERTSARLPVSGSVCHMDADGLYRWSVSVEYQRPRDDDGLYRWNEHRHQLGDALFTAAVSVRVTRRRPCAVVDVVRAAVSDLVLARRDDVGRLDQLDTSAPIVETVTLRRRRRFLSSFDYQESWTRASGGPGLYFLATLPGSSRARTVESALEDLAPAAVHAAILRGRDVVRQGDIFAIETALADADVYGLARTRARLTQWTRDERSRPGEIGHRRSLTAADRRRFRTFRRRRFRESFRAAVREAVLSGRAGPSTSIGARRRFRRIRETRAAELERERGLARAAVLQGDGRAAMRHRTGVEWKRERKGSDSWGHSTAAAARDEYRRRYGANAASVWSRVDAEARERFGLDPTYRPRERERIRSALSVHGTAHSATEVVKGPGGTVYLRGIMRHVPELEPGRGGERDHVDRRLGDGRTWYLALRNTVPRQGNTSGR